MLEFIVHISHDFRLTRITRPCSLVIGVSYKSIMEWLSSCIILWRYLSLLFVYPLYFLIVDYFIELGGMFVHLSAMQFKEMGGRSRPAESSKITEQPTEKKKGLADWMTFMKPVNEEKDHWVMWIHFATCVKTFFFFFYLPDLFQVIVSL